MSHIAIALVIIRLSLAIVFLITAYRIYTDPINWGKSIKPWALKLLPTSVKSSMLSTSIFDALVGLWLITGVYLWFVSILVALHMLQVLITTGIKGPQYRDVAILGAGIALLLLTLP